MKKEEKIGTPKTKKSEVKAGYFSLIKTSFSLAATVVALIAAAIAWFANNTTVTTENMQISAKRSGFELESEGEKQLHEALLGCLNPSILQWKLAQDSNLQNCNDQSGIRPNSSGSLSFYVIPLADDSLSINCTLDIRPVMKTGKEDNFDTAAKLLRGHLLFAYEYTYGDTTTQALVDVRNGTFQIQLPDAKQGQKQQITLHWFWPYTLHEANNHTTYGNEISAMTGNQEYSDYFFYDKTNTTGSVDVNSGFKILNQRYNDGDQLIGDKVKAVVLELTADLAL